MQRIKTLKISPEEARILLKKKAHLLNKDIFVDSTPDAVIDNYFLFSYMIEKSSTPLQGYYVNGLTREIEFRKSIVDIRLGQKYLPNNAYIEIEKW